MLSQAVKINPLEAICWSERGLAKRRLQLGDFGFSDFSKAIALEPTFTDAYVNRAPLHDNLNNSHLALEDYS